VTVEADKSEIISKPSDYYQQFDMIIASDLDFTTLTLINSATRIALRPFYATGTHGFYGFIFVDLIEHEYIIEREQSNIPTTAKPEGVTRSIIGVSTKRENGKNIEVVTKKEIYSHLLLANSSPLPQEYLRNRRKMRGVSSLLPALRALWEFERTAGRLPNHSREDLMLYTTMANEKLKELQMPPDSLKSDFLRSFLQNVGSEIVPTAAFVGGRLAEDVINVLGKREQPLQNTALFDGENFHGPVYALHPIFQDDLAPASLGSAPVGLVANANAGAAVNTMDLGVASAGSSMLAAGSIAVD